MQLRTLAVNIGGLGASVYWLSRTQEVFKEIEAKRKQVKNVPNEVNVEQKNCEASAS